MTMIKIVIARESSGRGMTVAIYLALHNQWIAQAKLFILVLCCWAKIEVKMPFSINQLFD
jgi:hypothetical protein